MQEMLASQKKCITKTCYCSLSAIHQVCEIYVTSQKSEGFVTLTCHANKGNCYCYLNLGLHCG